MSNSNKPFGLREREMPLSDPCEFGARLIEYELNQPPEDSIRNGL